MFEQKNPEDYWNEVVVRGLDGMDRETLRSFAEGVLLRVRFNFADPAEQVERVVEYAKNYGIDPIADLEAAQLVDDDAATDNDEEDDEFG